jgi:hypothetical protein
VALSSDEQRVLDELEASFADARSDPRRAHHPSIFGRRMRGPTSVLLTAAGLALAVLGVTIAGPGGTCIGVAGYLGTCAGLHYSVHVINHLISRAAGA